MQAFDEADLDHDDKLSFEEFQKWYSRQDSSEKAIEDVSADAVSSVSLAEARAWCRWAGRRLPTEAELHLAAFREPAPLPRGSDFSVKSPLPVDDSPPNAQGLYDLIGNGWEWTSTELPPQAGFTAHLRSQPSDAFEVFEGRHFVVVGCSWATDRRLIRRSFRNGYPHHYPYVWATFRTAAGEAA